MDLSVVFIIISVVGASALQAATGIGYGVIAGPILLIILNGTDAFQISVIHNILIAVILVFHIYRDVNTKLLKQIILGCTPGIPIGFSVLFYASIPLLKIFAVLIIIGTIILILHNGRATEIVPDHSVSQKKLPRLIGFLAGTMCGSLAMPGPVTAAWMNANGWPKNTVRATVLAFFIFAYGITLILHVTFADFSLDTGILALKLVPAIIVGILMGHYAVIFISEGLFRKVLLSILTGTVIVLVASL